MTVETFFEKFELLADAPNAVGKLRELVLEMGVTGRLLKPQGDWPVRELKSVASKIGSGATPRGGRESYVRDGVPLIRSMNVHFTGFDPSGLVFLTDAQAAELSNVIVQPDDVLLNITGASIGRVTSAPVSMAGARVNQHVTIIRTHSELLPRFLVMFLACPSTQAMINDIEVGATRQALTKGMIERFAVPLPPLAEQKRIVAKVDELMTLCDRLEGQQKEREAKHATLGCAALARFAEAPTPANLAYLFHPSYAIEPVDLRQSILTLAMQGKLVRELPGDDPVESVLAGVAEERENCGRASRRPVTSSPILLGYDIPERWRWQVLEDLLVFGPTNGVSPKAVERETAVRSLTLSATTTGTFKPEHSKFIELDVPPNHDLWLRDGDILVQRGNTAEYVGVSAVYRGEDHQFVYPDLMMKIRVAPSIDPRFVHLAMSEEHARDHLRARASGTTGTMPKINQATLKSLPLPVAPLAEQRRIVAMVDLLMELVDRLEAQLGESKLAAERLMEAVVAELTTAEMTETTPLRRIEAESEPRGSSRPVSEATAFHLGLFAEIPLSDDTPLTTAEGEIVGRRAHVAAYLLYELKADPHFQRTKLEKLNHLIEYHCGFDLGREPVRDEYGPNDYAALRDAEDYAADPARGWFTVHDAVDRKGKEYRPGPRLSEAAEAQRQAFGDKLPAVRALVDLLHKSTKTECEVIATLYAAWNDLLLAGKTPDDEAIIHEVRENWHPAKRRIAIGNWQAGLAWMRRHHVVPSGTGRPVPHRR